MNVFLRGLLLVGLLLLPVSGVSQSQNVQVNIEVQSGYGTTVSFNTNSVSVSEGATVTWNNTSSRQVKLVGSAAGISMNILPNRSGTHRFQVPGNYSVQAEVGSAQASMNVNVLASTSAANAQGTEAEPLQEFALLHSLSQLTMYPSTIVVRKDIPVRFINMGLESLDFHGPISILDTTTGDAPFEVVGNFSAQPGTLNIAEFTPTEAGEFEITHATHGHNISGTLIVVEDYPAVLAKLKELGQLELAAIHSLSELSIFPAELTTFEDLPVVLFNTAQNGQHNPVQILNVVDQSPLLMTVNGEANASAFPTAPDSLSVVEFVVEQPGEFEITHLSHGHPITGALVVKEEE